MNKLNRVCLPLVVWDAIKHDWPNTAFFNYGGPLDNCVVQCPNANEATSIVKTLQQHDTDPRKLFWF